MKRRLPKNDAEVTGLTQENSKKGQPRLCIRESDLFVVGVPWTEWKEALRG